MQQIAELIPIALFFITYSLNGDSWQIANYTLTFNGIYTATAVLMITTIIQVLFTWLITKKVEKRLWLLLVVILVTGSLTLTLQNKIFIQWKPTIFNWILALVFIGSQYIGDKKTLMQRMLGSQINLPANIWHRLSNVWVIYFIIVGILNLIVAYEYNESFWVSYKLYSSIGFTIFISIITALMIMPYLTEDSAKEQ